MSRSYLYLLPPIAMFLLWWYKSQQTVWFLTTTIIYAVSLFFFLHANKQKQTRIEAKRMKQLLARIRHDQMNHVQVLMGYQMMKKPEKISEYLERLVIQANDERVITTITNDELAVFLLTLTHRYPQWQWKIEKVETELELEGKKGNQVVQWLSAYIQFLVDIGRENYDWQQVTLQLTGTDGIVEISLCVLDAEATPVVIDVPSSEWINLKNQLSKENVQVHLVDQQQIKMRIPISR